MFQPRWVVESPCKNRTTYWRNEKIYVSKEGFPGGTVSCQCRRCKRRRFNPWVRRIPWMRKWQLPPVLLPGKFHGQRSLAGYSPWGCKQLDMTEWLCKHTHISKGIKMDKATYLKVFPTIQNSSLVTKSSFVLMLKRRDYEFYIYMLYDIQKRNKWCWYWNPLGKLLKIIMSCTLKINSTLLNLRNLYFLSCVVGSLELSTILYLFPVVTKWS